MIGAWILPVKKWSEFDRGGKTGYRS